MTYTTIITEQDAGGRCDLAMVHAFPQFSREQIKRWLENGSATLNGKRAKAASRVSAGDVMEINPPEMQATTLTPEDIPLDILYEDADLIVINKAPNMVVHPGAGQATGTLVHALLAHCDDLTGVGDVERPGIVHRLDKGTSGVMIVAKSDEIHRALQKQFHDRQVSKEYLACVHGVEKARSGVMDFPIGRHPIHRKKMSVQAKGRSALTRWECVDSFGAFASLWHVFLHTGRTHQVRVHCAHIRHPLVGDVTYGGGKTSVGPAAWHDLVAGFARPALHAFRLGVTHPRTQLPMQWTAPVPEDMAALLLVARRIADVTI